MNFLFLSSENDTEGVAVFRGIINAILITIYSVTAVAMLVMAMSEFVEVFK